MQLSKSLLALTIGVVSLTGCSVLEKLGMHQEKMEVAEEIIVEATPPERVESKPSRTSRNNTLSWDNIGRAGAAMHQPGYVHVLSTDGLVSFQNATATGAGTSGLNNRDRLNAISDLRKGSKNQSYSMYELSRWERYCNSGKGMDEKDWRFVKSEGYDNAPLDALGGVCVRPTYRHDDYMRAWVRFCTSSPQLDHNDRRIVGNSTRPFSEVNPCQALLK